MLHEGRDAEAEGLYEQTRELEQKLLVKFKLEQDALCGLTGTEMCCILMKYAARI